MTVCVCVYSRIPSFGVHLYWIGRLYMETPVWSGQSCLKHVVFVLEVRVRHLE